MKKRLILAFCCLAFCISSFCFATVYNLDFQIDKEGSPPLKGRLITTEGQAATLASTELSVKLLPTVQSNGIIKINAEIWETKPSPSNYSAKLSANHSANHSLEKATLITRLNNIVKITVESSNGKPRYSLTVTPSERVRQ